jgi:preprotein translocase subunit YajC
VKDLAGFLPFVLIALVFWFLIVRPQRRRQQELASTQAALGPGAEVMLGSGIFGTVASLDDETLRIEVATGTVVKVARQAVVRVVEPHDERTVGGVDPGAYGVDPAGTDQSRHIPEGLGNDQTDQQHP